MTCALSEDSDQTGLLSSLTGFIVRTKKHSVLCYSKTLIRLGGCPGWSESSLGAHLILLVLSRCTFLSTCSRSRNGQFRDGNNICSRILFKEHLRIVWLWIWIHVRAFTFKMLHDVCLLTRFSVQSEHNILPNYSDNYSYFPLHLPTQTNVKLSSKNIYLCNWGKKNIFIWFWFLRSSKITSFSSSLANR